MTDASYTRTSGTMHTNATQILVQVHEPQTTCSYKFVGEQGQGWSPLGMLEYWQNLSWRS